MRVVVVTVPGDLLSPPRGFLTNFVFSRVPPPPPAFHLPQAVRFKRAFALGRTRTGRARLVQPGEVAFLQQTGGTTGEPEPAI